MRSKQNLHAFDVIKSILCQFRSKALIKIIGCLGEIFEVNWNFCLSHHHHYHHQKLSGSIKTWFLHLNCAPLLSLSLLLFNSNNKLRSSSFANDTKIPQKWKSYFFCQISFESMPKVFILFEIAFFATLCRRIDIKLMCDWKECVTSSSKAGSRRFLPIKDFSSSISLKTAHPFPNKVGM